MRWIFKLDLCLKCYFSASADECEFNFNFIFNNLKKDFPGINARADYIDGDPDKESNFTVLMGNYYAVLIEWLFQDNKEEVILLKDKTINSRLVDSLVNSLIEIDEQL